MEFPTPATKSEFWIEPNKKIMDHLIEQIRIPERKPFGHKGSYGFVLCVGGSYGMSGAIALCSRAALITGAGLVRNAVPRSILDTVASFTPEVMNVPLPESKSGRISLDAFDEIVRLSQQATVVALGPGLGRSLGLTALVAKLYKTLDKPMIVDADALNALAEKGFEPPGIPRILTPHPGEFKRLLGDQAALDPEDASAQSLEKRSKIVRAFAKRTQCVTVLKGHRTLISDGESVAVNETGNPGMGTGGSGDVLTGMIAGLLAQHFNPFHAAVLGVHLHGKAGDFAAEKLGQESVIASAIIEHIPQALQWFKKSFEQLPRT